MAEEVARKATYSLSRLEYRKVIRCDKGDDASHTAPWLRPTVGGVESSPTSRAPSRVVLELSRLGDELEVSSTDSVTDDAVVVEDTGLSMSRRRRTSALRWRKSRRVHEERNGRRRRYLY